jgi:hypothetical protein
LKDIRVSLLLELHKASIKKLFKCPKPKSRKLVMKKVITNPTLESYLPNYFITKKLVITIQELVVGCMFL